MSHTISMYVSDSVSVYVSVTVFASVSYLSLSLSQSLSLCWLNWDSCMQCFSGVPHVRDGFANTADLRSHAMLAVRDGLANTADLRLHGVVHSSQPLSCIHMWVDSIMLALGTPSWLKLLLCSPVSAIRRRSKAMDAFLAMSVPKPPPDEPMIVLEVIDRAPTPSSPLHVEVFDRSDELRGPTTTTSSAAKPDRSDEVRGPTTTTSSAAKPENDDNVLSGPARHLRSKAPPPRRPAPVGYQSRREQTIAKASSWYRAPPQPRQLRSPPRPPIRSRVPSRSPASRQRSPDRLPSKPSPDRLPSRPRVPSRSPASRQRSSVRSRVPARSPPPTPPTPPPAKRPRREFVSEAADITSTGEGGSSSSQSRVPPQPPPPPPAAKAALPEFDPATPLDDEPYFSRWTGPEPPWRPGVNGGQQRYGRSGGQHREYYRLMHRARNNGAAALDKFVQEYGPPPKYR
jgi:hypothetical protein